MSLLRALVALAVALLVEAGLARLWPESQRYVDVMLVPVVWYATSVSQRSAMLVGCLAGLSHDAWFRLDAFGIGGFKKTLIGWLLGGLGARFDLHGQPVRFAVGVVGSLADGLLDLGLRRMLDRPEPALGLGEIALRAGVTGLLVVAVFQVAGRLAGRQDRSGRR